MVKYLLNVSVDITSSLISENFRGEGRWERNVLNALLSCGKQVHTTRDVWKYHEAPPKNFHNGIDESWMCESILMVHGAGRSLYIERDDARAYILQFHEIPFGDARQELLRYLGMGRMATTLASLNRFTWDKLAGSIGASNVYHVPGAMVPYVDEGSDNFRKPYVTWIYRNFKSFIEESPNSINSLFTFLRPLLKNEEELRIAIVVGMWDTTKFGVSPDVNDIRQWALSFPVMKQFSDIFSRIDFYVNINWYDILKLLENTRWIISPAEPLGCPAYEAAMFGIPTIVNKGVNPFITLDGGSLFPELLVSTRNIDGEFLGQLNRLQTDHFFYRKTGDAYRKFTEDRATFSAFVNDIDRIVEERGWNK